MRLNPFEKNKPETESVEAELVMTNKEVAEKLDQVVLDNLKFIKEELPKFLEAESVGGNAGFIEKDGRRYSMAAANFRVDSQGKITDFTNSGPDAAFLLPFDLQSGSLEINDLRFHHGVSREAEDNLRATMEAYNLYLKPVLL